MRQFWEKSCRNIGYDPNKLYSPAPQSSKRRLGGPDPTPPKLGNNMSNVDLLRRGLDGRGFGRNITFRREDLHHDAQPMWDTDAEMAVSFNAPSDFVINSSRDNTPTTPEGTPPTFSDDEAPLHVNTIAATPVVSTMAVSAGEASSTVVTSADTPVAIEPNNQNDDTPMPTVQHSSPTPCDPLDDSNDDELEEILYSDHDTTELFPDILSPASSGTRPTTRASSSTSTVVVKTVPTVVVATADNDSDDTKVDMPMDFDDDLSDTLSDAAINRTYADVVKMQSTIAGLDPPAPEDAFDDRIKTNEDF